MDSRTFENAFNAVFHDSKAFADFLSFDSDDGAQIFEANGRRLVKTTPKLKSYLRFIDRVIFRHLAKDDDVVHSFIKGKSTLSAVQAHADSKYFFLTDISQFYQNIGSNDVSRILFRDMGLIPISDIEKYIRFLVKYTTIGGSIPVGFPTSPSLSNSFLLEFDRSLKCYCTDQSLIYTRYADDIIISGHRHEQLADLKDTTQKYLEEFASKKMRINDRKTFITKSGNKVKILGLVLLPNGRITLDRKYKKKLELLLHFFTSDKNKFHDFLDQELEGKEHSLFGLLHYAKSIDPHYLQKLQRKYGVHALRYLMEDRWNDPR
ncbi:reverse transcriptase domain-containing protein [Allohahella sp. A8]|uniref:reverse transcriptase domain-containing protein n=1 Tax=Allohahella sp. A8 TaxID=3141461 RepID=UPI003A80E021